MSSANWKEKIHDLASNNDIVVFMRGTPEKPSCGFSFRVVNTLKKYHLPFATEDMDQDRGQPEGLWETLKGLNDWRTSPQIYVKGEFVGGCDIFVEMCNAGEVHKLLGIEFPGPLNAM